MGRHSKCKICGRIVKTSSKSRMCQACQMRKIKTTIRQMRSKKGKYYKSWKINLLNAIKKQPM